MLSSNRRKLLDVFRAADGKLVSGQEIADALECSRTAVWKHIEELKKAGFEIEAKRGSGYSIQPSEELFTEEMLYFRAKTEFIGQQVAFYKEVASTQIIAHQLVGEGAVDGTVVIADQQTAGKGRLARPWDSQKGTGIWMSTILRPNIPMQQVPQLTFIASLAVAEAIDNVTGLDAQIKWPNDLYIDKRKVCGVLTEMQAEAERVHAIIIGTGINVNQLEFPEELRDKATSLAILAGKTISRGALYGEIVVQLEKYYQLFLDQGFAPIKLLWEARAIPFQEKIVAKTLQGEIRGTVKGISDEGVLIVRDAVGVEHAIFSADISLG
ncbi:bifunctional biotin operon repressor/biotin-[acetyl-CoA-carboxylase] synthetase [Listeria weihenstephanensis FSL R9-0317]|uniref:Bifunctional ligase/repressor BirA n=1 Tax=Listeria weihenstephanensis TaxID=1006155 RepID=A0A1S7FTV8_9LIST|nr:biotin--[acetyl-CoA-carboxylase] ligase [Listeria weihenstephanensis]AQY50807.1 biotin--acetyl-CoA-carboxylase ligase [Listeria weihenstephanensis]EUJ35160.1 bifunctional biotin operon repressor/biotin-[acetyl-CoA-carboxylase] synthetase [Listeria weihenstephanensis FSL R9-0317]